MSKLYQLIVQDEEYRTFLFRDLYPHVLHEPKKKRFWQTQVEFGAKRHEWELKHSELITTFMDFYKELYPDFYEDWALVNFGFSQGTYKTFFIYVRKNEA